MHDGVRGPEAGAPDPLAVPPDDRPTPGGPDIGISVVCTLAEGTYFCGVAALANSLICAGFHGEIVIGYRGPLPDWFTRLEPDGASSVRHVAPGVRMRAVEFPGPWHLANLKARLLVDIFRTLCPDAEIVYYFDPDIVIDCEWQMLAAWSLDGVVMVLDVSNSFMSPHHVYRRAWEQLAARRGYACREVTGYVNSGCVGISRAYAGFAETWADLMDALAEEGLDMARLKYAGSPLEFAAMDQDILNATVMASRMPISLLGYEAMGVYPRRGDVMPHAMFHKKPWVRPYILDALRGIPPGRVDLAYWRFVDVGPIWPFDKLTLARKQILISIASFIGLFHVRYSRDL